MVSYSELTMKVFLAYRFYTDINHPIIIKNEIAEMNFPKDYPVIWLIQLVQPGKDQYVMAFRTSILKVLLSKV